MDALAWMKSCSGYWLRTGWISEIRTSFRLQRSNSTPKVRQWRAPGLFCCCDWNGQQRWARLKVSNSRRVKCQWIFQKSSDGWSEEFWVLCCVTSRCWRWMTSRWELGGKVCKQARAETFEKNISDGNADDGKTLKAGIKQSTAAVSIFIRRNWYFLFRILTNYEPSTLFRRRSTLTHISKWQWRDRSKKRSTFCSDIHLFTLLICSLFDYLKFLSHQLYCSLAQERVKGPAKTAWSNCFLSL